MPSHVLTCEEEVFQNVLRGVQHLRAHLAPKDGLGGRRPERHRQIQFRKRHVSGGAGQCEEGRDEPWSSTRDSNRLLELQTTKPTRSESLEEMDSLHRARLRWQ